MWMEENRQRYTRDRLRYPSDLTDDEWSVLEPPIPPAKRGGRKRTVEMREVVNGFKPPPLIESNDSISSGTDTEIFDVARVGESGVGEGLQLRPCFAVVRLVKQLADFFVLEHPLIHTAGDGQAMRFLRRNGGFHDRDGFIRQRIQHIRSFYGSRLFRSVGGFSTLTN